LRIAAKFSFSIFISTIIFLRKGLYIGKYVSRREISTGNAERISAKGEMPDWEKTMYNRQNQNAK
jgi:hypothetical protein